ncbi:MAG: hypothetical protein U5L45_11490 [Saprospiraceae bacterium]|nr:hypothetical protein [Saprospiraceae bacterium]
MVHFSGKARKMNHMLTLTRAKRARTKRLQSIYTEGAKLFSE